MTQNEIDNMAFIMPSSSKGMAVAKNGDGNEKRKKQRVKKLENYTSLNVAALKRLLPIGLNLFGGREQELVQQAKQKFIQVRQNRPRTSNSALWTEFLPSRLGLSPLLLVTNKGYRCFIFTGGMVVCLLIVMHCGIFVEIIIWISVAFIGWKSFSFNICSQNSQDK